MSPSCEFGNFHAGPDRLRPDVLRPDRLRPEELGQLKASARRSRRGSR
jgi:hypothetical protein